MRKLAILCALSGFTLFPVLAYADALPAPVQKAVTELDETCKAAGGTPVPSDSLIIKAELTGDDKTDYVINTAAYACEGAASLFGGTGGSSLSVFASQPDGTYAEAFTGMAFNVSISESYPSKLWLELGGAACGHGTAHATAETCRRALSWNAETRKFSLPE